MATATHTELHSGSLSFFSYSSDAHRIMLERDWYPVSSPKRSFWEVKDRWGNNVISTLVPEHLRRFDDPFIALVEAERWYLRHNASNSPSN